MSKSNPHHVICDGPIFRCLHCEESHHPTWPMPLDVFLDKGKGFIFTHRNCVKRPEPSRQVPLPNAGAIMGQEKPAPFVGVRASDWLEELKGDDAIDGSTDTPAPAIDPPGPSLYAVFHDRYPLARTWEQLLDDCSFGLTGEQFGILRHLGTYHWDRGSTVFNAVCEWARREHAHRDAELRARDGAPAIEGLLIPARLSMPKELAAVLGQKAKKAKGARPLSSSQKKGAKK